jgi:hypothetical protein
LRKNLEISIYFEKLHLLIDNFESGGFFRNHPLQLQKIQLDAVGVERLKRAFV